MQQLPRKKGNYTFAEELFLSVIRLAPQSASFINLATLYSRMATQDSNKGEVYDLYQQKMINILQEGLEVVGEDATLYSEIGFFHLYQGNVELAKEYLDHYLELAEDGEKKKHVQNIMKDINTKLNDDANLMQAYDAIQMNDEEKHWCSWLPISRTTQRSGMHGSSKVGTTQTHSLSGS